MRIALYSDLHLEMPGNEDWMPPHVEADVVVLAGDIHRGTLGLRWASQTFRGYGGAPEIIYVPGNHEFYGSHLDEMRGELAREADNLGIHLLDPGHVEFNGVRIIGTPLWTDFNLYGNAHDAMRVARQRITDYSVIRSTLGRFIDPTEIARNYHAAARRFLEEHLDAPYSGKTIVVTHFAPRPGCVPDRFVGEEVTPYFTVDMSDLMQRHAITAWLFGHTHHNVDFYDESGCRILSNQRGYPGEDVTLFRPTLTIEV